MPSSTALVVPKGSVSEDATSNLQPEPLKFPVDFVPDPVRAVLEWSPPKLAVDTYRAPIAATTHTSTAAGTTSTKASPTKKSRTKRGLSQGTRLPAFYDMHLAKHLRLKYLEFLPSLTTSIVATVDDTIERIYTDGRQLPTGTAALLARAGIPIKTRSILPWLQNEAGVAEYYSLLASSFCLPIASTLALTPSYSDWYGRLIWTRAPRSELGQHAIADGVLRVNHARDFAEDLDYLEPEIKDVWSILENRTLATWEMKSLTVGDFLVMNEIYEKAQRKENFEWKGCQGECNRPSHTARITLDEEAAPRGADALHPPWTWPVSERLPVPQRQSPRRLGRDTLNYAESSFESAASQSAAPQHTENSSQGTKRRRTSSQAQIKGKAPRRKTPDPDHPDARGGRKHVTSHSLLQQAWAQGVRHRSTIVVLHSGNHEIIGVRHRARQTLYVSEIIEPHKSEPAYGKLHVGLYISAVRDTVDRIQQERHLPDPPPTPDFDADDDEEGDDDDDDEQGSRKRPKRNHPRPRKGRGGTKGKAREGQHKVVTTSQGKKMGGSANISEATFNAASTRNIAYVHLHYGIYASPAPAVFVRIDSDLYRSNPLPPSPRQDESDEHTDSIDIILTSEKAPGSTGVVHLGKMNIEPSRVDILVAAKLAFAVYEKSALKHEYRIYTHLKSKGVKGIPLCFGLFAHDEVVEDSEGPLALVLSYAGRSLHNRAEHIDMSAKRSLLKTLKAIHKANVVHGDVRLANLCVNRKGVAFVIDFSHAKISSSRTRMDDEIAELCELLDIQDTTPQLPEVAGGETGLRRSSRIKEATEKKAEEQGRAAARNRLRK